MVQTVATHPPVYMDELPVFKKLGEMKYKFRLSDKKFNIRDTVNDIIKLINVNRVNPSVRELATKIIREYNVEDRDKHGMISAIYDWLQKNTSYIEDPIEIEFIQNADRSLAEELQGGTRAMDCDDYVVAGASMLMSLNIPVKIRLVSTEPHKEYNHIYLIAFVGNNQANNGWIAFDPIYKTRKLGEEPPIITKMKDIEITGLIETLTGIQNSNLALSVIVNGDKSVIHSPIRYYRRNRNNNNQVAVLLGNDLSFYNTLFNVTKDILKMGANPTNRNKNDIYRLGGTFEDLVGIVKAGLNILAIIIYPILPSGPMISGVIRKAIPFAEKLAKRIYNIIQREQKKVGDIDKLKKELKKCEERVAECSSPTKEDMWQSPWKRGIRHLYDLPKGESDVFKQGTGYSYRDMESLLSPWEVQSALSSRYGLLDVLGISSRISRDARTLLPIIKEKFDQRKVLKEQGLKSYILINSMKYLKWLSLSDATKVNVPEPPIDPHDREYGTEIKNKINQALNSGTIQRPSSPQSISARRDYYENAIIQVLTQPVEQIEIKHLSDSPADFFPEVFEYLGYSLEDVENLLSPAELQIALSNRPIGFLEVLGFPLTGVLIHTEQGASILRIELNRRKALQQVPQLQGFGNDLINKFILGEDTMNNYEQDFIKVQEMFKQNPEVAREWFKVIVLEDPTLVRQFPQLQSIIDMPELDWARAVQQATLQGNNFGRMALPKGQEWQQIQSAQQESQATQQAAQTATWQSPWSKGIRHLYHLQRADSEMFKGGTGYNYRDVEYLLSQAELERALQEKNGLHNVFNILATGVTNVYREFKSKLNTRKAGKTAGLSKEIIPYSMKYLSWLSLPDNIKVDVPEPPIDSNKTKDTEIKNKINQALDSGTTRKLKNPRETNTYRGYYEKVILQALTQPIAPSKPKPTFGVVAKRGTPEMGMRPPMNGRGIRPIGRGIRPAGRPIGERLIGRPPLRFDPRQPFGYPATRTMKPQPLLKRPERRVDCSRFTEEFRRKLKMWLSLPSSKKADIKKYGLIPPHVPKGCEKIMFIAYNEAITALANQHPTLKREIQRLKAQIVEKDNRIKQLLKQLETQGSHYQQLSQINELKDLIKELKDSVKMLKSEIKKLAKQLEEKEGKIKTLISAIIKISKIASKKTLSGITKPIVIGGYYVGQDDIQAIIDSLEEAGILTDEEVEEVVESAQEYTTIDLTCLEQAERLLRWLSLDPSVQVNVPQPILIPEYIKDVIIETHRVGDLPNTTEITTQIKIMLSNLISNTYKAKLMDWFNRTYPNPSLGADFPADLTPPAGIERVAIDTFNEQLEELYRRTITLEEHGGRFQTLIENLEGTVRQLVEQLENKDEELNKTIEELEQQRALTDTIRALNELLPPDVRETLLKLEAQGLDLANPDPETIKKVYEMYAKTLFQNKNMRIDFDKEVLKTITTIQKNHLELDKILHEIKTDLDIITKTLVDEKTPPTIKKQYDIFVDQFNKAMSDRKRYINSPDDIFLQALTSGVKAMQEDIRKFMIDNVLTMRPVRRLVIPEPDTATEEGQTPTEVEEEVVISESNSLI